MSDPASDGQDLPPREGPVRKGYLNLDDAPSEAGPESYEAVPWYRKSGNCSFIIIAHLVVALFSRCVPLLGLFGILTTLGVIGVCVSVLTGPIYYNKRKKDGTLKTWSKGNKVAAVIILVLFIGGYLALMGLAVMSGAFAGGRPA